MTEPIWHEHKLYHQSHQWRLHAAVCGFIIWEEQRVLGEHSHGSQHERHKQVQVDVVSRTMKPPARTHTHRRMWLSVFIECVTPVKDVVSKHAVKSWSCSRRRCSAADPRMLRNTFKTHKLIKLACFPHVGMLTWRNTRWRCRWAEWRGRGCDPPWTEPSPPCRRAAAHKHFITSCLLMEEIRGVFTGTFPALVDTLHTHTHTCTSMSTQTWLRHSHTEVVPWISLSHTHTHTWIF